MKIIFRLFQLFIFLFSLCYLFAENTIIPKPFIDESSNGIEIPFILSGTNGTIGLSYDPILKNEAEWLSKWLGKAGIRCIPTDFGGEINLSLQTSVFRVPGSYFLLVKSSGINIVADDSSGIFYGIQSLRQLLPANFEKNSINFPASIQPVRILDSPAFGWRGLMIDSSRHIQSTEYIKKTLDRMALLKLNVFHWHLSDDQGWRLEVKSKPKLTTVGAWRKRNPADPPKTEGFTMPGGWYGGFYSQKDVREIVRYAESLHITVVPELDMPGHATAAAAAYPELTCSGRPVSVKTNWSGNGSLLCPGKETTYAFITDILKETSELFPGKYFHIGGDEVLKTDSWKACPDCRKLMKTLGTVDTKILQAYFTKRVEDIANSCGKVLIGWDDIVSEELGSSSIIQYWAGKSNAETALSNGRTIILSPSESVYLDMNYAFPQKKLWAGWISTEKAYYTGMSQWEKSLDRNQIAGIEACLWTEFIVGREIMDWKLFPRLTAVAEAAWTHENRKNWPDFSARLVLFGERMQSLGIGYYTEPDIFRH